MFIPALFLAAAALYVAVWQGTALARQEGIRRVIDVRRLAPLLASLLLLTLAIMAWTAVVAGLGHGGRASATVPHKWFVTFLGIFVIPVSLVLFIRSYRIIPAEQRRAALWRAGATALALAVLVLTVIADMAGWPPILYASRTGHRDLERRLIAFGVDVNVRDRYSGWDPLTYAAWNGDDEITSLLLAAGARVYDTRSGDWPALFEASIQGHVEVVRLLLQQVDQDDAKNVALCFAARHGHPAAVNLLLDAGAEMYAPGRFGRNALQEACGGGHLSVVRLLLERSPVEVPLLDKCGNALLTAAHEEDLGSIQLLLDNGVDVNYQNDIKWTALMVAAQAGSVRTVNFLLDKHADPNVIDVQRKTALQKATEAGHDSVRELLLRRGARE
jgi:ankyrin repeat protein